MEKYLGLEYSPEERIQFLEDNCVLVEKKSYMKRYDSETLNELKSELTELVIKINDLEAAKKTAIAQFKAELEEPVEIKNDIVGKLKNKAELVNERCFKFVDEDTKTIGFYNGLGELIETRPMRPEEFQRSIFQIKDGTND